jgi:hypothetical protein
VIVQQRSSVGKNEVLSSVGAPTGMRKAAEVPLTDTASIVTLAHAMWTSLAKSRRANSFELTRKCRGMGHGAWGMGHGAWGMGHEAS